MDWQYRLPPVLWMPFLVFVGFIFVGDVFQLKYYTIPTTFLPQENNRTDSNHPGYFVKTSGCQIPAMKPFDKSIKHCLQDEPIPKCNNGSPALVDSNLTYVFVDKSSFVAYKIEDVGNFSCCYQGFWRLTPKPNWSDSNVEYAEECVYFNDSVEIADEFIRINCFYNGTKIYTDYFAFVPKKNLEVNNEENNLNVLVIGIDAVSRLNLHRQMPKTVHYLRELGAVDLHGYTKVGDNTFPNLIPVLTGLSEDELINSCWPNQTSRFDHCRFIWDEFKNKHYSTLYAENSAWMGLFNYQRKGFMEQPTDYYWGFYNWIVEKEIGNEHALNADRCAGPRLIYKTMQEYIDKFTTSMQIYGQPYFGFFWEVSLSHDFLNTPKLADSDYVALFKNLEATGRLENTVLVLMSDHGIRWGAIRSTYQGKVEERMPFVFLALPKKYREAYPRVYANLVKNKHRLTTPFDLHETLKDLIHPYNLTTEYLENRIISRNITQISRGYSLFDKIPESRTCEDAQIALHFCTCQTSTPLNVTDNIVQNAAKFAVDYINQELEGYRECAKLSLETILNAQMLTHSEHITSGEDLVDYTVTLRTQPGGGIFETTVRKPSKGEEKFEMTGTISRINLYGKQSLCITDFHLKLYCYCSNLFPDNSN